MRCTGAGLNSFFRYALHVNSSPGDRGRYRYYALDLLRLCDVDRESNRFVSFAFVGAEFGDDTLIARRSSQLDTARDNTETALGHCCGTALDFLAGQPNARYADFKVTRIS